VQQGKDAGLQQPLCGVETLVLRIVQEADTPDRPWKLALFRRTEDKNGSPLCPE